MDVYASLNNKAIHLGKCEVFLNELLTSERAARATKTPIIERWARVFPERVTGEPAEAHHAKPLGQIKYKMHLRKPVRETLNYYQQTNELAALERNIQAQGLKSSRNLVTINVLGCTELKAAFAALDTIQPFFYYQFYTFEERYSHNGTGINPKFDDVMSYEVMFDPKAISYFEKESLEIIVFDDASPIGGLNPDGTTVAEGDDMIGIAKIPLEALARGCSIQEKFPIINVKSKDIVGKIEVRISVMELERK